MHADTLKTWSMHCLRLLRKATLFLCLALTVFLLLSVAVSRLSSTAHERQLSSSVDSDGKGGGAAAGRKAADAGVAAPVRRRCRLFAQPPGSSARLGNRMFVHAAMLGLAWATGCRPAVYAPENELLRAVFQMSTSEVVEQLPTNVRELSYPWRTSIYVPFNATGRDGNDVIGDNENVTVYGYFQTWRYFADVKEQVRADFRFRSSVRAAADLELQRLLQQAAATAGTMTANRTRATPTSPVAGASNNSSSASFDPIKIGIHVRRNDMALESLRQRGYTVADEGYIQRAMSYVEGRLLPPAAAAVDVNDSTTRSKRDRQLVYVVCTDDQFWSRRYVRNDRFPVVFARNGAASSPGTAAVDLALLAACDHVVLTVGTFGWWAGFLAGGITVYDRTFPRPDSELAKDFSAEDYYPPDWTGLT